VAVTREAARPIEVRGLVSRETDGAKLVPVTQIWTGRMTRAAARYGEHAPMATVCCNACRACATTNALALASGAVIGVAYAAVRLARRLVGVPGQDPGGTSPSR
jgi:hypothetical protein